MKFGRLFLIVALAAAPALLGAQDAQQTQPPPQPAAGIEHAVTVAGPDADTAEAGGGDIIMPHIMDADYIYVPWFNSSWSRQVKMPRIPPIQIGGTSIDISLTRHSFMLLVAGFLCCVILIGGARGQAKHAREGTAPKGFSNGVEAVVLYLRNEVILPNVGHHGNAYVPFLITIFFFILFANLLGLIPYGSTATANLAVTGTLALLSFFMIEFAGMRTLGKGYFKTIVYWPHDMSIPMKMGLTLVLTPVEILGKFTKPFALAMRLFANMTAGHVIVLAFIGMIFTFQSWFVTPLPLFMAIAIMILEVLVAFLQAFIFTLLSSVFIGQIREGAH
jgi:F-type H+-transporting ATPase subunit a